MNYIKRLLKWIWEGKFLYILILLICAVCCAIFKLDQLKIGLNTESNIRVFGLLFQLIGVVTIVYSLKDKLQLFKGHGFRKFYCDYFREFPKWKFSKNVTVEIESAIHTSTIFEPRISTNPKENFKEIIKYFNNEIQMLYKKLEDTKKENKKETQHLKDKIKSLSDNLGKKIKDTNNLIIDSSVSNIWLESFGLVCIILGLILGTIPDLVNRLVILKNLYN